jgi:C-terminal processing protease CtpA/Prc
MKLLVPLVGCLFLVALSVRASESTSEPNQMEPTALGPYVVSATPFGYLGVKHATARFDLLRFVTFRGGLAYLQIDELFPDSPGVTAGIRQGDRIIGVNGKPIGKWSFSQLKSFGETVEVGQHVKVELYRPSDGSTMLFEIIVAKTPASKRAST